MDGTDSFFDGKVMVSAFLGLASLSFGLHVSDPSSVVSLHGWLDNERCLLLRLLDVQIFCSRQLLAGVV